MIMLLQKTQQLKGVASSRAPCVVQANLVRASYWVGRSQANVVQAMPCKASKPG